MASAPYTRTTFRMEAERQATKEHTYEVDELDYEQKVNYKLRIFETIFPKENTYVHFDIDKVLYAVDHIYEELTKI